MWGGARCVVSAASWLQMCVFLWVSAECLRLLMQLMAHQHSLGLCCIYVYTLDQMGWNNASCC